MDHTSLTLALPSGRAIGYALYGSDSPDAKQVFYIHGTPSSRIEASILSLPAKANNIRLISPDRPGIGLSSPVPKGFRLLDYPSDIHALAKHLSITTFNIICYSGGTPFALACSYLLPPSELLTTHLLSGVYPTVSPTPVFLLRPFQSSITKGLSHLAGSSLDSQLGSLSRSPDLEVYYTACAKDLSHRPEPEQLALKGVEKQVLWDPMREAFKRDGKGIANDFNMAAGVWGFKIKEVVQRRVVIWHGDRDQLVKIDVVRKFLGEGTDMRVCEGVGHVGALVEWGERVLKAL